MQPKAAEIKGSVYFIGDSLAATNRLELLCCQSKIRSRGMMQYQEKGHFVRKTLSCSWCNSCVTAAMPMVFGSTLTLLTFVLFFFFAFCRLGLHVTFRG